MVIRETYWKWEGLGNRSKKVQHNAILYDQELRQDFCNEITRTSDGGFQLDSLLEDEFGNDRKIKITISKLEIDFIVEQIKKGLL